MSILDVLQCAKVNIVLNKNSILAQSMGRQQLYNVVTLLEKGYCMEDDFDTVMGDAENVDDVPEKQ